MIALNKIYTRTGDDGSTGLIGGKRRSKADFRIRAIGAVDEVNAGIGIARQQTRDHSAVDRMLGRLQNDLFDLGADLASLDDERIGEALRISDQQVTRLETEIDGLNGDLEPLTSFVLPGGAPAAAALHFARTLARRAERSLVELAEAPGETISGPSLRYLNRLSDLLFVMARWANLRSGGDILWVPGKHR